MKNVNRDNTKESFVLIANLKDSALHKGKVTMTACTSGSSIF